MIAYQNVASTCSRRQLISRYIRVCFIYLVLIG